MNLYEIVNSISVTRDNSALIDSSKNFLKTDSRTKDDGSLEVLDMDVLKIKSKLGTGAASMTNTYILVHEYLN